MSTRARLLWIAIACAALALIYAVESDWGKGLAKQIIEESLARSGLAGKVGQLEGKLPREIVLRDLSFRLPDGTEVAIARAEGTLSLWRLFKKEVAFRTLTLSGVSITLQQGAAPSSPLFSPLLPSSPLLISADQWSASSITFSTHPDAPIDARGRFRIGPKISFIDASFTRAPFPSSWARATVLAKPTGWEGKVELYTPTADFLAPFIPSPVEGGLNLTAHLRLVEGAIRGRFEGEAAPAGYAPWTFRGRLLYTERGPTPTSEPRSVYGSAWSIPQFFARSSWGTVKGSLSFDGSHIAHTTGELSTRNWGPFQGRVITAWDFTRSPDGAYLGDVSGRSPSVSYKGVTLRNLSFLSRGQAGPLGYRGDVQASASYGQDPLELTALLEADSAPTFRLSAATLSLPNSSVQGALSLFPDRTLDADLSGSLDLFALLHHPELFGELEGAVRARYHLDEARFEELEARLFGSSLYYGTLFCGQASLFASQTPQEPIRFSLFAQDIDYRSLSLSTLSLSHRATDEGPFEFDLQGAFRSPFALAGAGTFKQEKGGAWQLFLNALDGSFYERPVSLASPATASGERASIHSARATLSYAEALLNGGWEKKGDAVQGKLHIEGLPIDFLSVNPLRLTISGAIDADLSFEETGAALSGSLDVQLRDLEAYAEGDLPGRAANGTIRIGYQDKELSLTAFLATEESTLLDSALRLPLQLQLFPFDLQPLFERRIGGKFLYNGQTEELLDFFNLSEHRFTGRLSANLELSGTLGRPHLEGEAAWSQGSYFNAISGTELTAIEARFDAKGRTLLLSSLSARDGRGEGSLLATGSIALSVADLFPYRIEAALADMQLVELPFATAIGKGNLLLEGNLEAGKASGALLVERADLSIPDKIPRPLPQLPVRIRNPQKPLPLRSLPAPSPYPLFLDLSIDAPDSVFVTGRGLSSEWNGAFQIDGRLDAISARGSLKLSSGEFSFSNRSFKLTDGSLTFTGRHKEMPTLDLSGTITQKGVAITARLKGPLNNPQITFQSVPPLPTGSILSYLLFGQDISEVTGFQALQLANTIASLSGASPDLLENTRRSLGVDRLRIITKSSSGDEGTDSIAVEVGKYVAEGVLVSFSQGTDDSSTNIRIEVDLKNGFTFEAETEQQQEQGIFSLKYNLNY